MTSPIVHSAQAVTLVGGGDATTQDLEKALSLAPLCVAADGGAGLVVASGRVPEAVIGDFDSVTAEVLAAIPSSHQHRVSEQDSTDFEKALSRIDAPLVIGVGFLGKRMDHSLAALKVLTSFAHRPCILLGQDEVICLAPPAITLPTRQGETVSLFPLARVTGRSTGLHWPIDGIAFDPVRLVGTSNRATGACTVEMTAPAMLLILPRRLMPALAAALGAPDALRWPVREG